MGVHTWRGTHNSSNPETQELSTLGGALTTVRLATVPIRRHRSCPHLEGHSQQFGTHNSCNPETQELPALGGALTTVRLRHSQRFQSGDTGVVHTWRGTHNSSALTTVAIRRHRSCPHLEGHSQQFESGTHNGSNPETQELSTLGGALTTVRHSQQLQSEDTGVAHTWRGTHNSSNPALTTVPIRRHRSCPHLE